MDSLGGGDEDIQVDEKSPYQIAGVHVGPLGEHLVLRLVNGAEISIPVKLIPELKSFPPHEIQRVILAVGSGLHWDDIDVHLKVRNLIIDSVFGPEVRDQMIEILDRIYSVQCGGDADSQKEDLWSGGHLDKNRNPTA